MGAICKLVRATRGPVGKGAGRTVAEEPEAGDESLPSEMKPCGVAGGPWDVSDNVAWLGALGTLVTVWHGRGPGDVSSRRAPGQTSVECQCEMAGSLRRKNRELWCEPDPGSSLTSAGSAGRPTEDDRM